jgi:hypothetical protein
MPNINITITSGFTDPNDETSIFLSEAIPAERHEGLFPNAKIPRSPNFNTEDVRGKPRYISELPPLNSSVSFQTHSQ